MTHETNLIERLCRCLAFHVVETEVTLQAMEPRPAEIEAQVVEARALIAFAGFDIDALYPPADRPVIADG